MEWAAVYPSQTTAAITLHGPRASQRPPSQQTRPSSSSSVNAASTCASGQPLLEALNVGNIDLSADVADTVPVFAQAAGAQLAYFARETPSPAAQAILVRDGSPLRNLADLKGKKVAVTKAAGAHYLLIAALAKAGLKFSDIQPAYLTPADGRAAFENGKVDAWVIWEPFLSAAQRQLPTRTLEGSQGLGLVDGGVVGSLADGVAELGPSGPRDEDAGGEGLAVVGVVPQRGVECVRLGPLDRRRDLDSEDLCR